MARFGRLSVEIPEKVEIKVDSDQIVCSGPKGSVSKKKPGNIEIEIKDGSLKVVKKGDSKFARSIQGTFRSHIINMIHGVTEGWTKQLEVNGAGYRVELQGKKLVLNIGFSHPVNFEAPEGITFKVEKNVITIEGADKEEVGQLAAKIRATRKPEPYKGSGIKYVDEVVRRKAGKQASSAAE